MDMTQRKLPHLHPITVHFPQALYPVALASQGVFIYSGSLLFESGAYIALLFGVLATPFCMATGFVDWKLRYKGAMTRVFKIKISGSVLVLLFAVLALTVRMLNPQIPADPLHGPGLLYVAFLTACTTSCVVVGHYGGRLVFH